MSTQKPCVWFVGKSNGTAVKRAPSSFCQVSGCWKGMSGSGYQSGLKASLGLVSVAAAAAAMHPALISAANLRKTTRKLRQSVRVEPGALNPESRHGLGLD